MSPAELRETLANAYALKGPTRFLVSRRARGFLYSDGTAAEAYIAQAVAGAKDLGVGSSELARAIRDWPSQYHLSPARTNLLRPIIGSLKGTVLEIGAGCGALTRLLGEAGLNVLALEGSLARARIAASRCRDLDNVTVVCDALEGSPVTGPFDVITLVGVLEYSRVYMHGEDPVRAMLEAARCLLGPGGMLVVAIENQLGGRYLAGAREDHLGEPWVGITGDYGAGTPVTFGRRELEAYLVQAGFEPPVFLYPFPDYKLPAAIVTEAALAHGRFNVSDLIATASMQRLDDPGLPVYSESLARDVFIRNGLGPDTANSFLVVAGGTPFPPGTLGWAYSVGRDRPYAGETTFADEGDGVTVSRRALFAAAERPDGSLGHRRVERERYLEGEIVHRGLQRVVARRGWSVSEIAAWARPWVEFLEESASAPRRDPAARATPLALPPHFFDCTPFNVVRDKAGGLAAFDLEWSASGEAPTLEHVVFRGLYNCLLRVDYAAPPAAGVSLHIPSLAGATLHALGFATSPEQVHEWIARDYALTGEISGIPRPGVLPELPSLRVSAQAAPAPLPAAATASETERFARLVARQGEIDSILARPHHRVATWVGGLVEPFPKLRALARAPFDALAALAQPRLGAIVHLYYPELWPEMRGYLARITSLERVYVSLAEDSPEGMENDIARDFPGAQVRRYPNRGRDVWPFLEALGTARRDGIELVCKVHGKRSPHVPTGEAWRRDMLDKLLGSESGVRDIVEAFRADPRLGLVGPGGHLVPSSYYWERNAARVTELCARMGVEVKGLDFRYVAGSMFWARVKALAPLLRLGLEAADFDAEPAPVDGTAAHAIERCFPIAARITGMRVEETANPRGTTVRDFAP